MDKSDKPPNLDDINYCKFTPDYPLGEYVQAIWFAYNPDNKLPLTFQLLSDCGSSIMMNFGQEIVMKRNANTYDLHQSSAIIGPSKNVFELSFKGRICTLGINLHPGAGHFIFNEGVEPFIDSIQLCNESNLEGITGLYSKVSVALESNATDNIFTVLDKHLSQHLERRVNQAKNQRKAFDELRLNDEAISYEKLIEGGATSKRDIQRKFKHYVGISPNVYQRLIKLNKLKIKLAHGEFDSLTQIAADYGYFDQAHFIRDFKFFMGITPKDYLRRKRLNK